MDNQEIWKNFFSSVLHYIYVTRGSLPVKSDISKFELVAGIYPETVNDPHNLQIRIWNLPEDKPSIDTLQAYTIAEITATYRQYKKTRLDTVRKPNVTTEMRWMIAVIRELGARLNLSTSELNEMFETAWKVEMDGEMNRVNIFKQVP